MAAKFQFMRGKCTQRSMTQRVFHGWSSCKGGLALAEARGERLIGGELAVGWAAFVFVINNEYVAVPVSG